MPTAASRKATSAKAARRADLYGARFGLGLHYFAEHPHVGDGQLGIGGGDDPAQGGNDGARRGGSAQDEVLGDVPDDVAVGHLPVRDVDLRFAFALRAAGADVADHADDGAIGEGEFEVAAERIFARPVAACEGSADDGGEGRLAGVGVATSRPAWSGMPRAAK